MAYQVKFRARDLATAYRKARRLRAQREPVQIVVVGDFGYARMMEHIAAISLLFETNGLGITAVD